MAASKWCAVVAAGYCILASAMVAFLAINGLPSTAVGTLVTATLIGLGLAVPALGMFELVWRVAPRQGAVRRGLLLQGLSLIGLVIGLLVVFFASSISGYVTSATFIALSGASGLLGAIYLSRSIDVHLLAAAAGLIAIGALAMPVSDVALNSLYWISDIDNRVYQDIGATVAACGALVAAYSFFVLSLRKRAAHVGQPHSKEGYT